MRQVKILEMEVKGKKGDRWGRANRTEGFWRRKRRRRKGT